ncbi:MAG TPA: flagellar protein FlgN, partial [Azoarcus taiwanensis]|nr:flagellar protein FlgN [Azoarcus taiwanensis]
MNPGATQSAVLASRLSQLMESEAALLRNFLELLSREESLLVAGETDALLALTKEKTELYHLLQRQHDTRARILGQAGLENNAEGIRKVCAALPGALATWDRILSLAAEARARNELNGKLITEHMQHNQAALSVLLTA